ncbi:hypothetical protein GCM10017690_08020 [Microbacterium terregens]
MPRAPRPPACRPGHVPPRRRDRTHPAANHPGRDRPADSSPAAAFSLDCTDPPQTPIALGARAHARGVNLSDDRVANGVNVAQARGRGILFHGDLLESGLSATSIHGLVARGGLVRLRRGAYARSDAAADADARHRLFVQACMALGDAERIASHWSAAAMHMLPLIGAWPSKLHVTDPAAAGGSSSAKVMRHRARSDVDTGVIDGVRTTSLSRTVVDMCRVLPFASAAAMVDEGLRRGLTIARLLEELDRARVRYGHRAAAKAIEFGDARAANAGESLSRARIHELGYAAPDLQVTFTDLRGRRSDVDFFWTGVRKIGEFDGIHKYTRGEYTKGLPPADVVVREKEREDALRPLVNSFDRWVWDDAISLGRFDRFLRDRGAPRAVGR